MFLKHYSTEKLKKEILEIIGKHLDLKKYRVFLFGSRVTGKGDERSDIDIGIEGQEPISLKIMSEIKEEIEELPILYKIDVVDFKTVSSDFKTVAQHNIEFIL
ncbi:MAG: nucleotidyltransferase domain-containing protein [bacterium]|nr:nucleotidyltransferase domain-containing protein [bacterium]